MSEYERYSNPLKTNLPILLSELFLSGATRQRSFIEVCAGLALVVCGTLISTGCDSKLADSATWEPQSKCRGENCEYLTLTVTHFFDNLVVMRSSEPFVKNRSKVVDACRLFYRHYLDEFDFVFLVYNLSADQFRMSGERAWGRATSVSNDVTGIGKRVFTDGNRYGAPNRLKTVLQLSARISVLHGPSLHELMHTWATNDVIPSTVPGHWGFSSANGQLGGFDLENLVRHGDGLYSAGWFGVNVNFGNSIPYSPIELYLAGWIPSSDVPDLLVAENPAWHRRNGEVMQDAEGNRIFKADGFETWSIERIIDQIGKRRPSHEVAPREFQAAVILLDSEQYPAAQNHILTLRHHIDLFSANRDLRDDGRTRSINFWTATGGRASLTMDSLEKYRIPLESNDTSNPRANDTVVDSNIQN